MNFINSIIGFFIKSTLNQNNNLQKTVVKYKKRSSYSIKGELDNVYIGLDNVDFNQLGFKIYHGAYHINALIIKRHNGKIYTTPTAHKAISYMHMTWNEQGRAAIGGTTPKIFRELFIQFCDMNQEALFLQIEALDSAWDLPVQTVKNWIKSEVEAYEKPKDLCITRSEGKDHTTKIDVHFDRTQPTTPYKITIHSDKQ